MKEEPPIYEPEITKCRRSDFQTEWIKEREEKNSLIADNIIRQFVNKPVYIDDIQAGIIECTGLDENGVSATIKLNDDGYEKLKEMLEGKH